MSTSERIANILHHGGGAIQTLYLGAWWQSKLLDERIQQISRGSLFIPGFDTFRGVRVEQHQDEYMIDVEG